MDLNNNDVIPDILEKTAHHIRFKFNDGTIVSPSDVFDKINKLIRDNTKEIRNKAGRLGELAFGIGSGGAGIYFSFGWYVRKYIENLEKIHGESQIQVDSEEITLDQMKHFLVNYLKKDAERKTELAQMILKDGLPKEFIDEDD